MKNRFNNRTVKSVFAATTISLAATAFGLTQYSHAADTDTVNVAYSVYVGSTKMFKIGYSLELSPTSYKAAMRLKPKGIAKLFANIKMVMNASGRLNKSSVSPVFFSNYQKKKKRKRTSKVSWHGTSTPTTNRTWQISDQKQNELKTAVKANLPDPMSAFLRAGITSAAKPCVGTQRIYDGSTVYDLSFKLLKQTLLGPKSPGSYKGPAYKCELRHTPVAGFSKKRLAKALANPAVFNVWFAPVASKVVGKTILIPVAATGTVKGRSFSAYTGRSLFNGQPM